MARWSDSGPFEILGEYSDRNPGVTQLVQTSVTWRPTPAIMLSLRPRYTRIKDSRQYITRVDDPGYEPTYGRRYVFATIDQRMLDLGVRTEWTISSRVSMQLYLQPYIASGDCGDYKFLTRARANEYEAIPQLAYDADANRYTSQSASAAFQTRISICGAFAAAQSSAGSSARDPRCMSSGARIAAKSCRSATCVSVAISPHFLTHHPRMFSS